MCTGPTTGMLCILLHLTNAQVKPTYVIATTVLRQILPSGGKFVPPPSDFSFITSKQQNFFFCYHLDYG